MQPEDGHYQAPKHVVVPYVENTLYSTKKYSCVSRVHTLYISYFIEQNGDDEPHEHKHVNLNPLRPKRKFVLHIEGTYRNPNLVVRR